MQPIVRKPHSSASLRGGAFRASVRASYQPGVLCRLPPSYPSALRTEALAERRKRVARASMAVALASAPRWLIVDTANNGAEAYRKPASKRIPLYSPLQCAILEALRHMRRWHRYADADSVLPAPVSQRSLDGCHCADCLTDAAPRRAWQASNRQRIRSEWRKSRARALTLARQRRSDERIEAALADGGVHLASASAALQAFNSGAAPRQRHRSAT